MGHRQAALLGPRPRRHVMVESVAETLATVREAGGEVVTPLTPRAKARRSRCSVIRPETSWESGSSRSSGCTDHRLRERSGMTSELTVQDETANNSDDSPADGI